MYTSKPQQVEAVQWTGENLQEVRDFFAGAELSMLLWPGDRDWSLSIVAGKDGAQGDVPVPVGHWVVRKPGDLTDHWPVDPEYFAEKYVEGGGGFEWFVMMDRYDDKPHRGPMTESEARLWVQEWEEVDSRLARKGMFYVARRYVGQLERA